MTPTSQSKEEMTALADELERDYPAVDVTAVVFSRDFAGVGCCVIPQDRVLAIVTALRAIPQQPATGTVSVVGDGVREALQSVADFMRRDVQSGDSDLWTPEYETLHDKVIVALSAPSPSSIELDGVRPSSAPGREEIARTLWASRGGGPEAFNYHFNNIRADLPVTALYPPFGSCLRDADAILALFSNGTGEAGRSAEARFESARLAEKLSRIVLQMQRTGDWRLSEPEADTITDAAKWLLALSSRTQAHE